MDRYGWAVRRCVVVGRCVAVGRWAAVATVVAAAGVVAVGGGTTAGAAAAPEGRAAAGSADRGGLVGLVALSARNAMVGHELAAAAREFGVPVPVLAALAYEESAWDPHGGAPSTSGGYGVMQLTDLSGLAGSGGLADAGAPADAAGDLGSVDPESAQAAAIARDPALTTAATAARLIGEPVPAVEQDSAANLRAGAALLASYARGYSGDWYAAVARYSGATDAATARAFADRVLAGVRRGLGLPGYRQPASAADFGGPASLALLGLPAAPPPVARTPRPECPPDLGCDFKPAALKVNDPGDPSSYGNYDPADRPTGAAIRYITIHDTEGSFAGAVSTFQNPRVYASAHYVIRASDGHVTQTVPTRDIAWDSGNWSIYQHSVSIEHEAWALHGATWYTEAQYETTAELVRYLAGRFGVPLDRQHVFGHDEVSGGRDSKEASQHWDPGPFWDWGHFMDLLGAPVVGVGRGGGGSGNGGPGGGGDGGAGPGVPTVSAGPSAPAMPAGPTGPGSQGDAADPGGPGDASSPGSLGDSAGPGSPGDASGPGTGNEPATSSGPGPNPGPTSDPEPIGATGGSGTTGGTTPAAVPIGGVVVIRPRFADNLQVVSGCVDPLEPPGGPVRAPTGGPVHAPTGGPVRGTHSGSGSSPSPSPSVDKTTSPPTPRCGDLPAQPANFVWLRTAPDPGAPLVADPYLHPAGKPGTDSASDWGDKADTGEKFVVAGQRATASGAWTAIWFGGHQAWFRNPSAAPAAFAAGGLVVTPRAGLAAIRVYATAAPERAAWPAPIAATALHTSSVLTKYSIPAGQSYVAAGPAVAADYWYAHSVDGSAPMDQTEVVGKSRYYLIMFNHRSAWVNAADVVVRTVG